ncbi:ATP phosphoribosyltransferase regulatory subunit [Nitrospira sp. KM1]|uniref:ATP phosphoribosyltransferase regulatory subunit n=1 Tax=Nitrospira sp. KM1 TaxID=1936990 RepID=UPI0013A75470|nr:ATP phosphoribosyltransferase regulatory subunit [Nitrospira sp. KM1]BCA54486.1 ATP phosphoribosyltransferase regulatory subunit [Nitrospira sp. KM1]
MVPAPSKSGPLSGHSASFRERSLVPVGVATILPHAAQQVRRLETRLIDQIARWGYDEIILPTFEYLDVLAPGLEAELLETCYQFVDRTTGRTLLLRPDATAQVARTMAMGLTGTTLPQRLSYRTSVFRYEPEHAGRGREIFQIGAELVGISDVAGDHEVISLLIECLKTIGLSDFTISLGHVGFLKRLLMKSGLSLRGQKAAEQAAARKDLPRLEEILAGERIGRSVARAIREAPELTGLKEVLQRGRVLSGGDRELLLSLDRLAEVHESLCAVGHREFLLLDLGEFRGFDYYDGIVFDIFTAGIGAELGGGGRYDHLIGRFGRPLPSTGFALDVDRLFRALKFPLEAEECARVEYLVAGPSQFSGRIHDIADRLRNHQHRVVVHMISGNRRTFIEQARSAGLTQRAGTVVVTGVPGVDQDSVVTLHLSPVRSSTRRRSTHSPDVKRMALTELIKAAADRSSHFRRNGS